MSDMKTEYRIMISLKSGVQLTPAPVSQNLIDGLYGVIAESTGKAQLPDGNGNILILATSSIDYITVTKEESA